MNALFERVRAFLVDDPDDETRSELERWLSQAERGQAEALCKLEDAFRGPLEFGTAGIRGILGPGESRMNRAVILRTTYGLVKYVLDHVPNASTRGIVIGRDARRMSKEFQQDAAEVCVALGVRVHTYDGPVATPLVSFGVLARNAAAGVMITASHNPPAYNGYKVYWENGAQIIPPHDRGVAEAIAKAPGARSVPRLPLEAARGRDFIQSCRELEDRYIEAVRSLWAPERVVDQSEGAAIDRAAGEPLRVAYSALHGVGERYCREVFRSRPAVALHSVPDEAEPDGSFPGLPFPNPEEPGAMDKVLALAEREGCDLALAHDPDADRLGAAYRNSDGAYVLLSGNEIGVLLGAYLLKHPSDRSIAPERRLVITTVVSSCQLSRIARDLGAQYAETLSGFKWIANEAMRLERERDLEFVFGYEEALGFCVGRLTRDKDGISAGIVLAKLAYALKTEGRTLGDALEDLRRTHGFFFGRQRNLLLPGAEGVQAMKAIMAKARALEPSSIGSRSIDWIWDLSSMEKRYANGRREQIVRPPGNVIVIVLSDESRVCLRPSGTEPKLKLYFEVREAWNGEPSETLKARAEGRLGELEAACLGMLGLEGIAGVG